MNLRLIMTAIIVLATTSRANADTIDWIDIWGGSNDTAAGDFDSVNAIALDASGNLYVTGGDATGVFRGRQAFVRSYDAGGGLRWSVNESNAIGLGIGVDLAGNVVMTGTNNLSDGGKLYKYNSQGNLIWQTGVSDALRVSGLAIDPGSGMIAVSGAIGTREGPFRAFPESDALISAFNPDGTHAWQAQVGINLRGPRHAESAHAVASHPSGDFVLGGNYGGAGGGSGEGPTAQAFAARFTQDGQLRPRESGGGNVLPIWGSDDFDEATDLLSTASGDLLVGGRTRAALAGVYYGGDDAFVSRLDGDGTLLWSRQWDASAVHQLARLSDEQALVLLSDLTIRHLDAAGTELSTFDLRPIFASSGFTNLTASSLAVFGDRVYVGGHVNGDAFVARLGLGIVPEPSSLALVTTSLLGGIALWARRRKGTAPRRAVRSSLRP
jgi:WD40 repeat protein